MKRQAGIVGLTALFLAGGCVFSHSAFRPAWMDQIQAPILGLGPVASDEPQDAERLEGKWKIIKIIADGDTFGPNILGDDTMVFSGGILTYCAIDGLRKCAIQCDPTSTPAAIDLTILEGDFKGRTMAGIYEVRRDTLRLCLRDDPRGRERPKSFHSRPWSNDYVFFLKRDKA